MQKEGGGELMGRRKRRSVDSILFAAEICERAAKFWVELLSLIEERKRERAKDSRRKEKSGRAECVIFPARFSRSSRGTRLLPPTPPSLLLLSCPLISL